MTQDVIETSTPGLNKPSSPSFLWNNKQRAVKIISFPKGNIETTKLILLLNFGLMCN